MLVCEKIYIIKGGSGGSVVGRRYRQGVYIATFSYQVCEDPMHCCNAVLDPKLLVKTVHLPCARVTREIRDDVIQ